ncbi:MAG: methyltransferase domain-containing protein [Alphaproteobacteria bacterium]|nr:methyltransferase domain-containing protein [Alphaproteobacteria bacterium]
MSVRRDLHEANRQSWNAATRAHNSHKGDQAAFFRAGGDTLFPEEVALLGPLDGRRLVHLQCNAGQDSLSLARRGAEVVGVDISDEAIDFARRLSAGSGIPATFERADVFDWLETTDQRFDLAFSSYGALGWLSDLQTWARGVARVLRPGGRLVVVEFHPVAWTLDRDGMLTYDYFDEQPIVEAEGVHDYVADSGTGLLPMEGSEGVQGFRNPHPTWEFQWSIAEILSAALGAGLQLTAFREYPYSNGCRMYADQVMDEARRYHPPPGRPRLPLMFGLVAAR